MLPPHPCSLHSPGSTLSFLALLVHAHLEASAAYSRRSWLGQSDPLIKLAFSPLLHRPVGVILASGVTVVILKFSLVPLPLRTTL